MNQYLLLFGISCCNKLHVLLREYVKLEIRGKWQVGKLHDYINRKQAHFAKTVRQHGAVLS